MAKWRAADKQKIRDRCKRAGLWEQFVAEREDQKVTTDKSVATIWSELMDKYDAILEAGKADHTQDRAEKAGGGGAVKETVSLELWAERPVASARQVVEWVFEHLQVKDVAPEDAPSAGAFGLLKEVQANKSLRHDFLRNIWGKMVPRGDSEAGSDRFSDDGREIKAAIERIERHVTEIGESLLPSVSEGTQGES